MLRQCQCVCRTSCAWARAAVAASAASASASATAAAAAAAWLNTRVQTEAVLFDFDGLLIDTETTQLLSWQNAWREHGLELDLATFFADHGGDVTPERYRVLAEAVGPHFDQLAVHARRVAFRTVLNEAADLREGMAAWLDQARGVGLRCAVASSSPRSWVAGLLDRVGRLGDFEVLAFGDEVAAHKPAPDVYLLALERLGVDPARAVAVEDTPHGVAAAQAAGMACIAIPNPFVVPERVRAADLVLGSAAEMSLHEALGRIRR